MKHFITLLLSAISLSLFAQPRWFNEQTRATDFPSSVFYTGFATGSIRYGETQNDATARLKKEAQAYVAEAIRVQVSSETTSNDRSVKINGNEQLTSIFESAVKTSATIELTGVKTDAYVENGLVYGFAYVNKYELIGYYNGFLTMNFQQLESVLNTAKGLETSGDKAKARKQYEDAVPLLIKVEQAQDVLVALDPNASLQRNKTAQYRSDIIQSLARLMQGIYVFVESNEDMFGKKGTLISSGVKAKLSKNGCSFTDNISQADLILKINASARKHGDQNAQIVFCYADVEVELIKTANSKTLYQEELKQKGGHTSYENAAREAFTDAGKIIGEKLLEWVK